MAAETTEVVREQKIETAPESLQTRRAREKLLKRWKEEETFITAQAIKEAIEKIHQKIANDAKNRVVIKEKFELFDQNKNAAALSSKVRQFADRLREDMLHFGKVFER